MQPGHQCTCPKFRRGFQRFSGLKKKDIPQIKKYILLLGFRPIATSKSLQLFLVASVFDELDIFFYKFLSLKFFTIAPDNPSPEFRNSSPPRCLTLRGTSMF